jgi:hypothetical protein
MNVIIDHRPQHSVDISVKHVDNPHEIYGDQAIVEGLIKDVNNHFSETANKIIKQALPILKEPPLTREKCLLLRHIIDQACEVVPNEMNKQGNLIMITKVMTIGLNKSQQTTLLNQKGIYQNQGLTRLELGVLAVSQQASDALNRYTSQLAGLKRSAERQPLLSSQQSSKTCCCLIL